LRFSVRDDGPGLPTGADGRVGIGLANTRARLEALHGSAQAVTLRTHPEGGAEATIELPYRPAPRGAAGPGEYRVIGRAADA
ncbi:MAG TPA: ATP-binding protein, partial [Planctomycetota bacterium]|nr:ATP-binding protein [Planctomycetota bacterium]